PKAGFGQAHSSVWDGSTRDITLLMGGNFADGKGNATAYVGYRKTSAVLEADRDFSLCTLNGLNCSGSSTSQTGRYFAAGFVPGTSTPQFYKAPFITVNPATGTFVPFQNPKDSYNFGALNYYMRPDERWNAGAFAHYNIDDRHQVYTELMFMDDDSLAQIAPSGSFIGSGTGTNPFTGNPDGDWTINCNNPYLSDQEALSSVANLGLGCASHDPSLANTQTVELLGGRRNVEGGNRITDIRHTS